MKREAVENIIRDYLANNLSVICNDLSLIKKEYYLPNILGTRGFIDILAKDNKNNYVIIELKRTNEASREALHEILKYVEALKQNKNVKESEIRVIIISTKWNELLVPFSSFVNRVKFNVQGFLLGINEQYYPISTEKIVPLELKCERLFSPLHTIGLYENKQNLEKGIKSHIKTFNIKGISNFVLVILTPPDNYKDLVYSFYTEFNQSLNSVCDSEISLRDSKDFISYPYMIYAVFLRLSEEKYLDTISKNTVVDDDIFYPIEFSQLNDEERYSVHEENLINMEPQIYYDFFEISYPAKFCQKLLKDEGWIIEQIQRFGTLKDNELLEDSVIISEIAGKLGADGVIFEYSSNSKDIAKIEEMKKGAKKVLHDNKVWFNHINFILEHHTEYNQDCNFDISLDIFYPHNILFSIYKQLMEEKKSMWLPIYKLSVDFSDNKRKCYYGTIEWNGTKADIDNIISKYYQGESFSLVRPISWGGYEENDLNIMKELGFSFGTILYVFDEEDIVSKYEFENFEFVKINMNRDICDGVNCFNSNNIDFILKLTSIINESYKGASIIEPGAFNNL